MENGLRALGWLPDVPSIKDYTDTHDEIGALLTKTALGKPARGARSTAGAPGALPAKVDLRSDFSPLEDQGSLGSCTAQAAVGLLEYFGHKTTGAFIDASRLFVYKATRDLLGWTGDTGAYIRSAMGALVLFGAPPERYWPYDARPAASNARYDAEPTAFCYAYAADFKALKYFRLDPNGATPQESLQNVKRYIAEGFPSMFGFPVYNEFDAPLPGGLVPYPSPTSHLRGGHAIVALGYDDNLQVGADTGALLIRNSWGTTWGDGGYGWLSYRYVTDALAMDWWTLIKAAWVDTGKF
jgi:C1A family cysteine protease